MNFIWWILMTGFHQAGDLPGVWTFTQPVLYHSQQECESVAQTLKTNSSADLTGNYWCLQITVITKVAP